MFLLFNIFGEILNRCSGFMNKRILLIDKDPAVIDVITLLLESEGYQIYVSKKPFEHSEIYDIKPDLILIHNGLANEGSEISKRIKSEPGTSSIPVILTSTNPNIAQIARENGADNYLLKPFDIDELCLLIGKTIQAKLC